jgi:hypothetical protein
MNALNKQPSSLRSKWGVRGLKAPYHKKNAILLNVMKICGFIIA